MTKKPKLPPKITKFIDDEERELIESIENNYEAWVEVPNMKKRLATAREAARNTLRKDARVNVRLTNHDLRGLKAKAAVEGIPYQTLLTALVHKYVSGQIKIFS